jgi:hypothetical protein
MYTMKHPLENHLLAYAAGRLSDEENRDLEAHLLICQDCRDVVEKHLDLVMLLTQADGALPIPEGWEERLMARVSPERQVMQSWNMPLTRRLRVLLHTRPMLELRDWDLRREPQTQHFDSLTLAMRVFDVVIESMGLGSDADSATVFRALLPLLRQMDHWDGVALTLAQHQDFTERLLGRLRNDQEARRPFRFEYTDFVLGKAMVRVLELRLLEERFSPTGEGFVLQLSSEAINLFLNAFNLDIEDAQVALEAVIQSQLERGRVAEAAQAAQDARLRSVQFRDKIERILLETRRDLSRVDWRETVPQVLKEALLHVDSRLKVEQHITLTALERLDALTQGTKEAREVALIAGLMEDCQDRHIELQRILLGASNVFFNEQDRQAFMPRPSVHWTHVSSHILEPLLEMSRVEALKLTQQTSVILLGTAVPPVFSLSNLIAWCLRPKRQAPLERVAQASTDWTEMTPDQLRFPSAVQSDALGYLQNLPVKLSDVLQQANHEPLAVREYLGLQTLQAFESDLKTGLQVDALGSMFVQAGFYGHDLQITAFEADFAADFEQATLEEQPS